MKKNFYVCDSYHTNNIAKKLNEAFPDSKVFTDSSISSVGTLLPLTLASAQLKAIIEGEIKKDEVGEKIDFFILSAKLINDGSVVPTQLKTRYGNNDSKIIAVSMSIHYLMNTTEFVDFAEDKNTFFSVPKIQEFFSKIEVLQ